MSELTDKLRAGVKLRFNRVPLEDFIRMCQQAADRIDELEAEVERRTPKFLPPDDMSGDPPPLG